MRLKRFVKVACISVGSLVLAIFLLLVIDIALFSGSGDNRLEFAFTPKDWKFALRKVLVGKINGEDHFFTNRTSHIGPFVITEYDSMPSRSAVAAELQRDVPKATWEPIFFKSINPLATRAGWKSLREAPLPSESLEVRVWIGFGSSPLQGYSLRRDASNSTGRFITESLQRTNSITARDITPTSGWDKFWTRLIHLDLLTLPDSSMLHDEVMVPDGVSYVVEINRDGRYRTYEYSNPQQQQWPEAKKIISIVQTLHDEFTKE